MIELNSTVIIQLAIVFALMVILSTIVFKPFLRVLQARRDWVDGAEKKAKELQQRTEELMEKYRQAMAAAQAQGANIREEIRKESLARETEILQRAMEGANGFLGEMKSKIQEEVRVARGSLRLPCRESLPGDCPKNSGEGPFVKKITLCFWLAILALFSSARTLWASEGGGRFSFNVIWQVIAFIFLAVFW